MLTGKPEHLDVDLVSPGGEAGGACQGVQERDQDKCGKERLELKPDMTSMTPEINDLQAGATFYLFTPRHVAFTPPSSFVSLKFQLLIYFPNWSHKNC